MKYGAGLTPSIHTIESDLSIKCQHQVCKIFGWYVIGASEKMTFSDNEIIIHLNPSLGILNFNFQSINERVNRLE